MEKKTYRCTRACKPMAHVLRDRQNRFLPRQRLAQDIREEAGCGLVRRSRPDANRRQPQADSIEESTAAVIGEKKLAYRLLSAVARERRIGVVVGNLARKGGSVNGNRRGEDEPRPVGWTFQPDGFE